MHFFKKLMVGASFITATFAADGLNLDRLPMVQAELAGLQGREEFAPAVGWFNEACSAINRAGRAANIKGDKLKFLLSQEGDPKLRDALKIVDDMPTNEDEKENFRTALQQNSLAFYSTQFDAFLTDVNLYPDPFVQPLLGVLSLIAGRGQTYTGCGAHPKGVSEEVRAALFGIFERTGFLSEHRLMNLRAPYDVKAEVEAFLSANPNVDTLIIGGSHVGTTMLPYDPHRGALVVNLDSERGADIVAKIQDVLPYLPTWQFANIVDGQ